jgi:hypothetical protein
MEQDTLMSAGDTENVTDLFARQPFDVAKDQNLLLNWGSFAMASSRNALSSVRSRAASGDGKGSGATAAG